MYALAHRRETEQDGLLEEACAASKPIFLIHGMNACTGIGISRPSRFGACGVMCDDSKLSEPDSVKVSAGDLCQLPGNDSAAGSLPGRPPYRRARAPARTGDRCTSGFALNLNPTPRPSEEPPRSLTFVSSLAMTQRREPPRTSAMSESTAASECGGAYNKSVAGAAASSSRRRRRCAGLDGRKPAKWKASVGSPDATRAASPADGPGKQGIRSQQGRHADRGGKYTPGINGSAAPQKVEAIYGAARSRSG
jgi:hypothetical protein